MAIRALSLADTITHVLDSDPCKVTKQVPVDEAVADGPKKTVTEIKEGATKFFLKPLDVFLMGYIYDNASTLSGKQGSEEIGIHTRVNQTNIEAVRFGLTGFSNFLDEKGEVKWATQKAMINGREYDAVHDDVIKKLGVKEIAELAGKVKEISEVSKVDEKNSAQA